MHSHSKRNTFHMDRRSTCSEERASQCTEGRQGKISEADVGSERVRQGVTRTEKYPHTILYSCLMGTRPITSHPICDAGAPWVLSIDAEPRYFQEGWWV